MTSKNHSIMSFTDVMDKTFDIHKKNMGSSALYLFLYYIITIIAYIAILLVVTFSIAFSTIGLFNGFFKEDVFSRTSTGGIFGVFSIFIIILSIVLLFKLVEKVGIIDIASKSFLNKPVGFEKALGLAFKKIPAIFTLIIAYGIICIPIIIAFILIGITSDTLFTLFIFPKFEFWMILLGIGLAVIYIYLSTIYMFSVQTVVLEKLYFFKALKRSRLLVKNNFWRLFGINTLFYIVVLAVTYSIYSFFAMITGLIILMLKGLNFDESSLTGLIMVGNFLRVPLQIVASLFISPLRGIFSTILYYNQRFKNEGYDIELEAEYLREKMIKEKKSEISNVSIDSNERKI